MKPNQEDNHFNDVCKRYRQMMKSIENKPFSEKRQAINNFRAGIV